MADEDAAFSGKFTKLHAGTARNPNPSGRAASAPRKVRAVTDSRAANPAPGRAITATGTSSMICRHDRQR